MSARERILRAVAEAAARLPREEHPGPFAGRRPGPGPDDPLTGFSERFEAAGGEVVRLDGTAAAAEWVRGLAAGFASVCAGEGVPAELRPPLTAAPPERAELAVSTARGAVAETGSLILGAEDGRRAQLLAPVHVVFVRERDVHATLREALTSLRAGLPAAVGLHSGPSKSADLGQVMVKGVHGPGRLIAVVLGEGA